MKVQVTLVIDIPPTHSREELDRIVNELEVSHIAHHDPLDAEVIDYELLG
jgi:hypothetical protein